MVLAASTLVSPEPHPCASSLLTELGCEGDSSVSVACPSGISGPLLRSPLVTRCSPKGHDCNDRPSHDSVARPLQVQRVPAPLPQRESSSVTGAAARTGTDEF